MLQAKLSKPIINVFRKKLDKVELWHKSLGHINEKGLTILAQKKQLLGMKNTHLEKCSHCLAGKRNRASFHSSPPTRKSSILDLVHLDLCGPMKTRSLGGTLYFMFFTDDHSRKICVYILKSKDQVLDVFKQFQELFERQTRKKLKCIKTDNRGRVHEFF